MVQKALLSVGLFLVALGWGAAFAGCGSNLLGSHPLTEVADSVPVSVLCPATDGTATRAAIIAYRKDPEALEAALVEQAKTDPVSVACLLLDARAQLLAQGRRAEQIYEDVQEGLKALGVQ
jgi:hypothetical protein